MKAFLAKFPLRRCVGLYLGEREVVLSRVALTPLGPLEVERRAEPRDPESLGPALQRLLEPLRASKAWRRAPVGVGLPAMNVFFSTRPATHLTDAFSPQEFLHEILRSANLNIDHMEVDVLRGQVGRRPVASVAACRKRYLSSILEALGDCDTRPHQVEPAPCALLRAAVTRHRTPGRVGTALRIFLGRDRALAVLTAADAPLMWRYSTLEPGAEATALLSTYRSIQNNHETYGAEAPPAVVMLHGRPDLAGLPGAAEWRQVSARVLHYDGPAYEAGEVAPGLALGCLPQVTAFNLAPQLRPPVPVLGLLPWGQMAVLGTTLLGATLLLTDRWRGLEQSYRAVRAERVGFAGLTGQSVAQLGAERDDLLKRTEAIERYLSTRVLWTTCADEVAARLPEDMVVVSLDGQCEYVGAARGNAGPRSSLSLALQAPIPQGEAIPLEVEGLLKSLRSSPVLRKALPTIEMTGLHWEFQGQSRVPMTSFVVLCRPGAAGPPKPPG